MDYPTNSNYSDFRKPAAYKNVSSSQSVNIDELDCVFHSNEVNHSANNAVVKDVCDIISNFRSLGLTRDN